MQISLPYERKEQPFKAALLRVFGKSGAFYDRKINLLTREEKKIEQSLV